MNPDFVDLLRAFIDASVRFVIVGAYAVAIHARPRATGDLDVWVEPTPENAAKVMNALRAFGAPLQDVAEADFAAPGITFQMGVEPGRIAVLTEIGGGDFAQAWSGRVEAGFGPLDVPFLGRAQLIANKRAVGRPQDLMDLDALER